MGTKRTLSGAVAGVAAVLLAGLVVQPASGITYDSVVSDNPSNNTPNVNQGAVTSIAKVGNTMVAVGKFSTVTAPNGGATVNRTNIFAFNADTGAISGAFVPTVNGTVTKVLATGDGSSVFIAGTFTTVNGQTRSRVARLNVSNGSLTSFAPPALNGVVNDMVMQGGRLYIGGAFKKIGAAAVPTGSCRCVAALNSTTGANTGQLAEAFTDVFNGGTLTVKAIDIADDGSRLAAVGNFRTVNGHQRTQMAVFDTSTSPATLAPWSTDLFDDSCATVFDTYMRDVSISPDSRSVYVATTGAFAGGADAGTGCDVAARFELAPNLPDLGRSG